MLLTRLECRNFRCLHQLTLHPAPGVNLLRGAHAQGNTSILEAILFAATSKSHRTSADSELPTHGEAGFFIRADAARSDREVTIEASVWKNAKRFKVNGVPQTRLSDILGKILVVFF